jgi:uncharacterized repeat protein (TIGR03806 family)
MRSFTTRFFLLAALCAGGAAGAGEFVWTGTFERSLSAYGIFEDPIRQIPNANYVPYDVVTPMFSDYADKHRFVYVPDGLSIQYRSDEAFEMPVGSVLVKTFSYPADARWPERGRRLVETRLMVHDEVGWTGAAYVWNEEQTDATLKIAGAEVPVDWVDAEGYCRSIKYLVPDMNQCKNCHRDTTGAVAPIGIKSRHLNRPYDYADGAENQLRHWAGLGKLKGAPDPAAVAALPRWDDATLAIADRALAYLEMNCAHCHNPAGLASHTRLDLRWSQTDPELRGVMKKPTTAGNAARGRYFAIVPGDAADSFLLHRITSTRPDVRMPPMGRTVAHEEGAAVIEEWIESLSASGPNPEP